MAIDPKAEIILFGSRARDEAKNDWDSYKVTPLYKNIAREGIAI